ncbi:MAG: hypothetical protein E7606_00310 [Ruminococcaceae bacterium]|nr:hypothetical protein [Oscillospiraceae bacterium]
MFFKPMMPKKPSLKAALSRFNFRLVISLAVSIIFFLGVYLVIWDMGHEITISIVYGAITLAAAMWYIYMNKGLVGKLPTTDELPATWDKQMRENFLADLKARRQKSKKAFLIIVPMIFTFFYKLLDVYVFPNLALAAWFSALFQ